MFPFLLILSAIVTKMRDFLRCQKRSLLTKESKTKTERPPRVQNLAERKCSVAKRKFSFYILRHELDVILCRFFLLKFQKKTVTNTNQIVGGKENVRFKKL